MLVNCKRFAIPAEAPGSQAAKELRWTCYFCGLRPKWALDLPSRAQKGAILRPKKASFSWGLRLKAKR